ncbi:hypothetical protein NW066_02005 [Mycoplasmopsis felis]|uniref:hypothetical protein n=1 Tax=Mycoplasmopsis felis TaxID=33923 RepID=UPI0021AF3DE1|nr:hypothetical protein [Mycoplasmopsis felis]UWV85459.1 hypothetical protein NW066_02005 [Mycoplasmopsis felis]
MNQNIIEYLNILIRYHKILKMRLHFLLLLSNLEDKKYSDVYKKGLLGDGLSYNSIVVGAIRNNDFLEEFSSNEEVKQVKKLML